MAIQALPEKAAVRLKSSQAITDPASVVKELVDNSLDAGATKINVIVSENALDLIKVTDNGCGVHAEDRDKVGRHHHTSKLSNIDDLCQVGGLSLGFRGDALASIAELSDSDLVVMTRTKEEEVGSKILIGSTRKLNRIVKVAVPCGTTVLVQGFLRQLPVRHKKVIESSQRSRTAINDVLRSFALARPWVRFQLRISEAKKATASFDYFPPAGNLSIKGAAYSIFKSFIRTNCALHAKGVSPHRTEAAGSRQDYAVEALVLRPSSGPPPSSGPSQYISIDARPISARRGIGKGIVSLYKKYLNTNLPESSKAKKPFICLNLYCPLGSYDANVEPAKDDVLFENTTSVLHSVGEFFASIYGQLPSGVHETTGSLEDITASPQQRSRSPLPTASTITNPWTLAKLNAPLFHKSTTLESDGSVEKSHLNHDSLPASVINEAEFQALPSSYHARKRRISPSNVKLARKPIPPNSLDSWLNGSSEKSLRTRPRMPRPYSEISESESDRAQKPVKSKNQKGNSLPLYQPQLTIDSFARPLDQQGYTTPSPSVLDPSTLTSENSVLNKETPRPCRRRSSTTPPNRGSFKACPPYYSSRTSEFPGVTPSVELSASPRFVVSVSASTETVCLEARQIQPLRLRHNSDDTTTAAAFAGCTKDEVYGWVHELRLLYSQREQAKPDQVMADIEKAFAERGLQLA